MSISIPKNPAASRSSSLSSPSASPTLSPTSAPATSSVAPASTPATSPAQASHSFQEFRPSPLSSAPPAASSSPQVSSDPALSRQLRASLSSAHSSGAAQLQRAAELRQQPLGPNPGATALSSTGRTGGTGAQGLADPVVPTARTHSASVQNQVVNWSNRPAILNNLSQIDSDQGSAQGGNDAIRCGAASLLAGSILQGPERFQQSLGSIHTRGTALAQQLQNSTQFQAANGSLQALGPGGQQQLQSNIITPLQNSLATINELRQRDPSTLTHGEMQRLQEALYQVAIIDQRTTSGGQYSIAQEQSGAPAGQSRNDYLTTGTIQTYRDLMWGSQPPQMNGRPLDVHWISNESGGGHFVLADQTPGANGSSIAFNPWPDSDGTAFSRGVDGNGFRIIPLGGATQSGAVRGMDIDQDTTASHLPSR